MAEDHALDHVRTAIESFLAGCREPRLLEPGQKPLVVDRRQLQFTTRGPWLQLEAWDHDQFFSRRLSGLRTQSKDRLELAVERFGGKVGTLVLYDAARPRNQALIGRGRRQVFAESFRAMLRRQFPRCRLEELSSEASLQYTLSPAYSRALLRHGDAGIAAMGAAPDSDVEAMLSFALIWLDYLRRREPALKIQALAVFLPAGKERNTCLRLRLLDPEAAQWLPFVYTGEGHSMPVDLADWGNLETSLEAAGHTPQVVCFEPEALIEEQVRAEIEEIDASLRLDPIYGQVPAFAGGDRGILDLLACDSAGRLAVMELKASECVHLPLQALDYWMRVNWHLEAGDFEKYGFFPGIALGRCPPRLLLVAPAIQFHPSNEQVIRFFHPSIEVERIGLAPLLSGRLKVMFRQGRLE